ncbi:MULTISPECIES: RIP metalloprotease RseP [Rufibacter]|uniref:Zinc metalloprotease n=1 Tax=Rufibacter quisquiliarum TaxID=1549639 RepID=A0A839GM82_9BACT|nr:MULTISPECIES: RIP metalloprotease RseP [Rufibacter]MBA9075568.1 regulator of sigma E protease [Rufibacter quisquiliarum]
MDALVMAGQLILGLTILVGIHELGHMLTAKWFGMRVEKYAIGFPPKLVSKQVGETEYMIGMIPLGGFVKISGMVDESLDTAMLSQEPQPWEFRAKPAWQRLIVMMGGIIFNVITGILIFAALTYVYGESYLLAKDVQYGIVTNEIGQKMGLRDGDKIVAINGNPLVEFNDVYSPDVLLGQNASYTVERNGQQVQIKVPVDLMDKLADGDRVGFILPREPFAVEAVKAKSNAAKAGLQAGDRIVKVNGQPVQFFHEFQLALQNLKGKTVPMQVERNGQQLTLNTTIDEDGVIGFQPELLLPRATREYGLLQSIPVGAEKAFGVITTNIKGFAKIFRREVSASKALSGPIGIAQIFGGNFSWVNFWAITAMLSMVLAFMNFLPIPALDGGHVMFLTYEMISGRKPSDKFLENAQKVGMVLLLGLMGFAIFNDFFKLLFN